MSFRSIVRDVRDGFGSLSRRSFEVRLPGHSRGKSRSSVHELQEQPAVIQNSRWASLPPELLRDVINRLEASESTWPGRKHVVACAAVCKSWREMCKEIVSSPELCGKITFPIALKQPGHRNGTIQCFIKRDKSKLTYHLFLCLSPALLVENGKFLLSAKRTRRTTCTEYIISMDADNISRSSSTYIGKLRSNFLGTKFIIYDTQPPYNNAMLSPPGRSRRFSKKVSPKVPSGSYNIGQVTYELNVLGTRGPRRMNCTMYSIPASSLEPNGVVPGQPELLSHPLEDSFRSISFSKSIDNSTRFSSSRFSDIMGTGSEDQEGKVVPLVLKNKSPRWHEQLQCWCLNFRGRVTVASVKNFQLIAATSVTAAVPSVTFVLALILRLERVKMNELRSQAKVVGTMVTFAGALLMTLYKGPQFDLFHHSNTTHQQPGTHSSQNNHSHWVSGTLFICLGCFAWSSFYILQSITVKRYPAELSLASLICLSGALQSAVVALIADHNPRAWAIGFDYTLYGPLYTGIMSSGIAYYIQGLVMQSRGPVFVTSFNPLCMIIVTALGSLLLGEHLYLGSIIGGIIIAVGLYSVVWGKGKDYGDTSSSVGGTAARTKETETMQLPVTSPNNK